MIRVPLRILRMGPEELLKAVGGDSGDRDGMVLMKVLHALLPRGVPSLPSDMKAAIGGAPDAEGFAGSVATVSEREPTGTEILSAAEAMRRYGAEASPVKAVDADYGRMRMTYIVCTSGYRGFEGTVTGSGGILESADTVYAEIVITAGSLAAWRIAEDRSSPLGDVIRRSSTGDERRMLSEEPSVIGKGGLFVSRRRFDALSAAISSTLRRLGVIRKGVTDSMRLNTDLRNKTKRTMELERGSRFLERFEDVEICNEAAPEQLDEMYSCFDDLVTAGLLPIIPSPICIRIRKRISRSMGAVYYHGTRTMVVSVDYTGAFVHEYIHAYDYNCGRPSLGGGFRTVLAEYRRLVRADGRVPERRRAYYSRPEEAFARCYEMHLLRITGPSALLEDSTGKPGYPGDRALADLADAYFEGLRAGWARSEGIRYPLGDQAEDPDGTV